MTSLRGAGAAAVPGEGPADPADPPPQGAPLPWVAAAAASPAPPAPVDTPPAPAGRRGRAWRRAGTAVALVVLGAVGATLGTAVWALHRAGAADLAAAPSVAALRVLARVASGDLPEVVTVVALGRSTEELGTAWPIDGRGDFITNDHVVRSGVTIHVLAADQREYTAVVARADPRRDLALLHVFGLDEPAFPLAPSAAPLGEPVVVLAAEGATGRRPVTESRIVGLDEAATVVGGDRGGNRDYRGLLRMPSRIFPGNSGGPVLTERGQVVGVLTLAARSGTGAFAIPVAILRRDVGRWRGWPGARAG
ncbi:MAG TPA: serine protease [Candidatus Micrarchaeia archaeon]|nr:serine protease [Candidatus Micrarchaeia archaeon]